MGGGRQSRPAWEARPAGPASRCAWRVTRRGGGTSSDEPGGKGTVQPGGGQQSQGTQSFLNLLDDTSFEVL